MSEKTYRHLPVLGEERVLVAEDIPLELELRVISAIAAYLMGVKSIDRVMKQYEDIWREHLEALREEPPES